METCIITRNEFIQRYWKYYIMLENNFLNTERYLAIDELNFCAFSNEYIMQYQIICSEIDIIAKAYCKEIDSTFCGKTINAYCKCLIDHNTDFNSRKVKLTYGGIELIPWKDWKYTSKTKEKTDEKIISNNPDWWQKYNKVKHNRTATNNETGLPYYKLANQGNVLNSLAALFQLEMYYYRLLRNKYFQTEPDIPTPSSILFEIENWGNNYTVLGENLFLHVMD